MLGDEAGATLQDADFIDVCNDAQLAINTEVKMIRGVQAGNTVVGTTTYALPADFILGLNVQLNDTEEQLKQIYAEDLNSLAPNRFGTGYRGRPKLFYIDGMELGFYPTPDSVISYDLRYVKQPTALAAVGDSLSLPIYMHPAVVTFAKVLAKQRDEDWEAAEIIRSQAIMEAIDAVYVARSGSGESYSAVRDIDTPYPVGGYTYD